METEYYKWLITVAIVLRSLFLVFGNWMDQNLQVQYTDVDYHVFTDAARAVNQGGSPYDRDTYRYTPFLAYLLLPNLWLTPYWGKAIFCASDLLVGDLIWRIVASAAGDSGTKAMTATVRYKKEQQATLAAALWLLNPLVINFSTRGSADAIVSVLVLATVFFVQRKKLCAAAFFHGLAVHFKIYPVIFSLAYLVALGSNKSKAAKSRRSFLRRHVTKTRVLFTLLSASTFFLLTALGWMLHGQDFLHHGLLYHLTRTDNRHNFSPWFYPIYLDFEDAKVRQILGLLAFLPQVLLLFLTSLYLGQEDLPFCVAIQTFLFVTFNKVCTAQYFSWYFAVFPAALPTLSFKGGQGRGVGLGLAWVLSLGAWLFSAFHLEFQGLNTFFWTWLASIGFLYVNVGLISWMITEWSGLSKKRIQNRGKKFR